MLLEWPVMISLPVVEFNIGNGWTKFDGNTTDSYTLHCIQQHNYQSFFVNQTFQSKFFANIEGYFIELMYFYSIFKQQDVVGSLSWIKYLTVESAI